MRTRTILIPIAVAAALGLNSTAGATTGTCTVTAQPFNNTSYHLAYTHNGTMHTLIAHQDGRRLEPTSFDIPADFDAVYWATKRGVIDGPDSFYTVLHNAGGCQFVETYNGGHSNRPSVVIAPGTPAPTTTSSAVPPSTTTVPPSTTTAPTTTVVTVTIPPVTVTRVTELPPATFPPTWPEQPSTTLPDGLDLVGLIPSPTPYTAVQPPTTLPATGASSGGLALFGLALLIPGALLAGLARLRNRHQHGRNFTAS